MWHIVETTYFSPIFFGTYICTADPDPLLHQPNYLLLQKGSLGSKAMCATCYGSGPRYQPKGEAGTT